MGIFFGWLPGVLTGSFTNLFIEAIDGFESLAWPFAIVNMATGLVAGLLAADRERYLTIARQIGLILLITAVNTVLGAFIVNIVYGGYTGTAADILVSALVLVGRGKTFSSLIARIPTNLVDKGLPILLIYFNYRIWCYRKESLENMKQFAE